MSALGTTANSLLVFVDETGHEGLADPRFPVFGLGGCALPGALYDLNVRRPWLSLKAKEFGGESKALHACEAQQYSRSQKEAIGQFFQTQLFGRFGVVLKNTTSFPEELFRYQVIVGLLEERLRCFAAADEFESAVLILESSERTNYLAEKYFSQIQLRDRQKRPIAISCYFMQKSCRETGLEVADFVVNAFGGRAKARASGNRKPRKDFQSIFQTVGKEFVSFVEIDRVDFKRYPQTLPSNLSNWTLSVSNLEPAAS